MGRKASGKNKNDDIFGSVAGHPIESYEHTDKERLNNPPVGLVTPDTDPDDGQKSKTYVYDPHLDPALNWDQQVLRKQTEECYARIRALTGAGKAAFLDLEKAKISGLTGKALEVLEEKVRELVSKAAEEAEALEKLQLPYLQWTGKAEHTSFEIPTVSLHVHERIDSRSIIEAVKRPVEARAVQLSLFDTERKEPLREAIEFYRHSHGWKNRLVAGDSLLVMNSLLEKEGMAGKVQMVYIDPPYGIKYGSNFQPFVNKRDVKDGKDEDLTSEPEQIRAFRDTWELGIHSYLTYLRDRLLLARELLTDSGSVFVQISDENVHHVREIMDDVFGAGNFVVLITFQKTGSIESGLISSTVDYIIWYAKDKKQAKYHSLYTWRKAGDTSLDRYDMLLFPDGTTRRLTSDEILSGNYDKSAKRYQLAPLYSDGASNDNNGFEFQGAIYKPRPDTHWKTTAEGLKRLAEVGRVEIMGSVIRYRRFAEDFPVIPVGDRWESMQLGIQRAYVVQTAANVIQRCLLMTTDPGDLVFDPTCGSGTTAYVAEQWGRRWISCDTSRVALTLAKQRLMTAVFDYYELARPHEGVGSGFLYKTVPHITLKSIANNEPPGTETLYDQPLLDRKKRRVSGPFTVEAVPAPAVKALEEVLQNPQEPADPSIARSGETLRQNEWRDELLRTGIRGKAGQHIRFARLEPLPGCRWLHADGETKPSAEGRDSVLEDGTAYNPQRIVVSFGPEHAPLEQRQVAQAIEEAQSLVPKPKLIVFAAFQFDPEAAKDVDETNWPGVTLLKAQMNADMLTDDLKKKRASNESFWLIGQPDVAVSSIEFLVFSGGRGDLRGIAEYGAFKKLSGLGGLEETNRLGWTDLFLYALLSQGRDVWRYLAYQAGWDFNTGKYSGWTGPKYKGGVSSVSWRGPGFSRGIGDFGSDFKEFGISDLAGCRDAVERLRGNRQIIGRLEELAQILSFPVGSSTKNYQLKTQNYYTVEVQGFDYYNTKTGGIESGGVGQIAVWLLDTDYDGRSLYPRQVFFPQAGKADGWSRLAKNLKAEIDGDLIEAYRGVESLPFSAGEHKRIAVKIVDDRGIESLKVMGVPQ